MMPPIKSAPLIFRLNTRTASAIFVCSVRRWKTEEFPGPFKGQLCGQPISVHFESMELFRWCGRGAAARLPPIPILRL